MIARSQIIDILWRAIDIINAQRPQDQHLPKDEATVLAGVGGQLDSLGLINFIVATEQQLEDTLAISLSLTDERIMAADPSPLRSVAALADYIAAMAGGESQP